jgi:hypothetical protein
MQVKRMFDRRGIDHAEVNRIALGKRQAFVVRPRLSVERQGRLEAADLWKWMKPFGDQPDAFLRRRRWGAGRVDDEGAGELRIEPVAVVKARQALERRPVEEVSNLVESERDVTRCAGRDVDRVTIGRHRAAETTEHHSRVGTISDRESHRRSNGCAEQWARHLWRFARLGEREDAHHRIMLAFWLIARFDDVERQRQRSTR